MKNVEVEVKYRRDAREPVRNKLIEMGAQSAGRHFEANLRYDNAEGRLTQARCLLRLRKDEKVRLTHKSPHADSGKEGFKIHKELEVEVSDFETTDAILKALGFEPVQRYEKWRETFYFNGCEVCLDSLPFGEFIEVEGEKEAIDRITHDLKLPTSHRIVANYLALFEAMKSEYCLLFNDLTFDHFKGISEDFSSFFERFQSES